ncbi:hypothetical protein VE01_10598 [Pseudogymnoascus verrucosus]|uniref:beta-glucosidase n=1 Tax=Pseudogymnoascus verrucosus TaxID=342668 RepID=A0A1B8G6C9_9PEZI|nr:uncharacterized protein VE01_10598 [Pseudogymnoascus verrucosus]OBT91383.1 hypothetical protein VE01_10598 [Pseudogymnoascus verrucosus]
MLSPSLTDDKFDGIVNQLSLPEKVGLLSGAGACRTSGLQRLNIPSLNTSDGPHGLRGGGGRFFNPPPGYQLPSATAIGATFDVNLMHHPVLSGTLALHYINGLQERQVAACIKHYAAHDQSAMATEDDVHMTERTLREIHLMPFQIAMKSQPWAFMASYNRINGLHVSESPFMLTEILRKEWKFDGLVMSDWWGTYSTSEAVNAGLDLEMPGPAIWRGKQLVSAVECRKVPMKAIDTAVRNVLKLVDRTHNPTAPRENETGDTEESRALTRKVAADAIVLLKNHRHILPLAKESIQTIGLIGEHFKIPATCGGGSSEVAPFYVSTPFDAIVEALGADRIQYHDGCYSRRWTPLITSGLTIPKSPEPGLLLEWFGEDPTKVNGTPCVHSTTTLSTSMYFSQMILESVPDTHFIRIKTIFAPEETCKYRFALSVCGKAKLIINGREVVDLWTDHPKKTADTPCFNKLSMERLIDLDVEFGQKYDIVIIMTNETDKAHIGPTPPGGVRLGGQKIRDEDEAINEAVDLARNVDIPIVLAGLSSDYEYEASDRASLKLPGRMDEMIQRVAEANPKTIVITQAGMPFEMPWIEATDTLVHAWLGGQETGHAIADVLLGAVNPSGRLSITFPRRLEDTPTFLNFGKADRHIVYGEGIFVGHRYYEMIDRPPLFYFGYGLSYTDFEYSNLIVPDVVCPRVVGGMNDVVFNISVDVTNVGTYDGSEVIQVYITDLECSVQRPKKEFKAFQKVYLAKGERRTCHFTLDKYALSFWSEEHSQWITEAGDFVVVIATSADPADELLRVSFTVTETFLWSGL